MAGCDGTVPATACADVNAAPAEASSTDGCSAQTEWPHKTCARARARAHETETAREER